MLDLLIDYAKTHGLTVEPGFKSKTVRWVIVCDAAGHFLGVQKLGNPDDKNNRGQTFNVCPDLSLSEIRAGGPGCRHFLVDNIEVVALIGKNGDLTSADNLDEEFANALKGERKPSRIVKIMETLIEEFKKELKSDLKLSSKERSIKEEKLKKAEEFKKQIDKHEFFKSLMKQSAIAMKDASALVSLLDSEKSLSELQHAFADQIFKPTDSVTFAITGRTPMFLVDDNIWHDWWRGFRQSLLAKKTVKKLNQDIRTTDHANANQMRCFGSGRVVEPALVWPKIEGLSDVGGLAMGDVLASFKQESFQSYFLTQSNNAAVSEEMAVACRAGLNDLIKQHSQRLTGAKVVHWYSGPTEVKKQEDVMGLLDNPLDLAWLDEAGNEKDNERDALHRAKVFLDALRSGTKPRLKELEKYRYYAMILSANSGRVVTRDWIEGQFGELAESILAWFKDLEITSIHGERSANSPSIERVITCLLPPIKQGQKYSNWIKPIGGERSQLWHAAISRKMSLPHKVLSRLMPLHQAFILSGDFDEALDEQSRNRVINLSILYTRMGLLKAYHIRKGDKHMQPYLNEEHPHSAYHCGRLMAVLAEIQQAALGNVGASVIQRYYAAASATPALVFGRLVRTSNYHLEKIEYRKKRLGLKDVFTGIWSRLKDEVPKVLNLEAQSLFALGFYQQMGKLASIDWTKYENQFTTTNDEGEKS
jgi:CRISPR-associated protein Csd1